MVTLVTIGIRGGSYIYIYHEELPSAETPLLSNLFAMVDGYAKTIFPKKPAQDEETQELLMEKIRLTS